MADAPDDAFSHQADQDPLNRGVWLSQDARQLRRIDERLLAERVKYLSV